jgi:hypothetical protein
LRRAHIKPAPDRDALLASLSGKYVVIFPKSKRWWSPKSGNLKVDQLSEGLVAVAGPRGEAEEWIVVGDILYVKTDDGVRHGPY